MKKIMDGNEAAASVSYLFSEVAPVYPITPSTPMAEYFEKSASKSTKNIFNEDVKVVEMESEAGVAGALHGSLLSGSLSSTFTSSQGLLLMIPNMYKIAGEGLPAVIQVASRTVATHALSIYGDHSDVYAVRQTGFCMMASSSVEDAYYLSLVSHLASIKGSLPFLHFFDGFRTSHELNVVNTIDDSKILELIDKDALKAYKDRCLNIGKNYIYGTNQGEDIYFETVEARTPDYKNIVGVVNEYMSQINKLAGTDYKPYNYYGSPNAKYVIVAMGSVCDTIKEVLASDKATPYGLIEVHLFRPFSTKSLLKVLPKSVRRVAVLDKTKEQGSAGEPLYLDVLSALSEENVEVVGGRYGLSSKNTTTSDIYSVYKMLEKSPKSNFTIGINDNLNKSNIEYHEYKIDNPAKEILVYGYGSDGSVGASKDILKLVGKTKYVQGFFEYDARKSGGLTISHLRICDKKIKLPYKLEFADLTVITNDEYFTKYNCLDTANFKSDLLINTKSSDFINKLTKRDIEIIKEKQIKIYTVDASTIAEKHHLGSKISQIMEACMLKLLGRKKDIDNLINNIETKYELKGKEVIKNNKAAIKDGLASFKKYIILRNVDGIDSKDSKDLISKINSKSLNISVKDLVEYKNGCFEKSNVDKTPKSKNVPRWISENCIQCGMCSAICPHAVIRPFLINDDIGVKALGEKEYNYLIGVSELDCTGCGLCESICPGKNGKKALVLDKKPEETKYVNDLFKYHVNPTNTNKFTIKGSQLEKPCFENPLACAGCGETAYIKLLTQLYGKNLIIANATGCSSIYGGSVQNLSYSIPWANSLFEDNAEFALGMHISYNNQRNKLRNILVNEKPRSKKLKELYTKLLDNFDNFDITNEIKTEFDNMKEIPSNLVDLVDYIPARTVVALGGDGWAYDIGFAGIDHVLSSNENINIMVLDTEMYSNTGGQSSKSSRAGEITKLTSNGKLTNKKDLFKIATTYSNCYVGSICLGANIMQAIKTMKEAIEHEGPSLIICYAPCNEHGIKGGMSCSYTQEKLAVECGYTLLMRYNPIKKKLYMDSKTPDFNKYDEYLESELRYSNLKKKNEKEAQDLLKLNKKNSVNRYNYYINLSNSN